MRAIRTADAYKRPSPPRNLTPEKTVRFAVSTDDNRPQLQHVHYQPGVMVAADGFRLHTAPQSERDTCPVCETDYLKFPDWQWIVPTKSKFRATIDAGKFRAAAVVAGIFSRDGSGRLIVTANGEELCIRGTSEERGESKNCLPYIPDPALLRVCTFAVNYRFLIDALDHVAPEGGPVVFSFAADSAPLLFEAGDRRAVVMPMVID